MGRLKFIVISVILLSAPLAKPQRQERREERRGDRQEQRREQRQKQRRRQRRREQQQQPQPLATGPWAGILDPSRAIDWTHAGVQIRTSTQTGCQWVGQYADCVGGLPTNRTKCTAVTSAMGADANFVIQPSGVQDSTDAFNINNALQACNGTNTYVQLAAGTFWIVGGITFGAPANIYTFKANVSNVTLRGMGPDQTYLRSLSMGFQLSECSSINIICIAGNAQVASSQYYPYAGTCQWTAGYAKDTTSLTFTNCYNATGPNVGDHIILDQRNDDVGLTQCTNSDAGHPTWATCTVSLPSLPSTFVVGACVGIGQMNNQAGMGTATNPGYNTQPLMPQATPTTRCNAITAVTTNTFSYALPFTASPLPTVGPCNTPTSPTFGPYVANSLASANVNGTSTIVTICGWATVDPGGYYVTGVPCVTMAGTCAWGSVSGGLTIGRFCPDISGASTTSAALPRSAVNCQPGEISNRSQTQVVTVTNVSPAGCATTCTVTIDTPIYATNWRASQAPGVWWFTQSNYHHDDGIESMTWDGRADGGLTGQSSVAISKCFNCWIRNVRSVAGSRNHIWLQSADSHITIRDSYIYGTKGGASSSYGIELFGTTGDVLLENNIIINAPSAYMNGGTWGSVEAYTYANDDGNPLANWMYGSFSLNHDLNGNLLFESNDGNGSGTDDIHGTITGTITVFRQRDRGQQNMPYKNTNMATYVLSSRNRGHNFIGGVLGTAGAQTTYQVASTSTTPGPGANNYGRIIWSIGSTSQGGSTISDDALVLPSVMRWGNYNVVTPGGPAGILWCGTGSETNCGGSSGMATTIGSGTGTDILASPIPASHTLPTSFYLSARPAFFATPWGTPPWPAIGPDIVNGTAPDTEPCPGNATAPWPPTCTGGYSYSIPSQLAYDNAPLDAAFQIPQTVTGATWTSGTVTLTGTFNIPTLGNFLLSGMTPSGYNGIYRVYASNGPSTDAQTLTTQNAAFTSCGTGFTCSSPGAGITVPAGPVPPGGSYYLMVAVTRVSPSGELTKGVISRQTVPNGCTSPSPTGNCAVQVMQPCYVAAIAGVLTTCAASGNSLGGANASNGWNVYMGWGQMYSGTVWLPSAVLCKQNATPIPYATPTGGGSTGNPSWGNAYVQRDPIITPTTGTCVQPPTQSTATATQIQYLFINRDTTNAANPGGPGSGGTMIYPIIKVFNADNYYGTGTPPPVTGPQGITGHGTITGQGKIT